MASSSAARHSLAPRHEGIVSTVSPAYLRLPDGNRRKRIWAQAAYSDLAHMDPYVRKTYDYDADMKFWHKEVRRLNEIQDNT